ncbi:hypothetical protein [Actinomadura formosensis]|uniref:hypothetical protein n=1 Tax=Actinomadura formosensis TaxID=60706 RepID=UPI001471AE9A|nr:hypothetical protein [Actinomadura formosensis]
MMENEDRPFAWLVNFYRAGYEAYVRFLCVFYTGQPGAAKAADPAHRTSGDAQEEAP